MVEKIDLKGDLKDFILKENFSQKLIKSQISTFTEQKVKYKYSGKYPYTLNECFYKIKNDMIYNDKEQICNYIYTEFSSFVNEENQEMFKNNLLDLIENPSNVKTEATFNKEMQSKSHRISIKDNLNYEFDCSNIENFITILTKPFESNETASILSISKLESKSELKSYLLDFFKVLIENFFKKFMEDFKNLIYSPTNNVSDHHFKGTFTSGITITEKKEYILSNDKIDKFFRSFDFATLIYWRDKRDAFKNLINKFKNKKDYHSIEDVYAFLIEGIDLYKEITFNSLDKKLSEFIDKKENVKKKKWKNKLSFTEYFYTINSDEDYALNFEKIKKFLNDNCSGYTKEICSKLRINFGKISLIKEADGNIRTANLHQETQFIEQSYRTSSKFEIADFYPFDETTGYIILKDYPVDKSTLCYYKLFPTSSIQDKQTFSHSDARLVLNIKVSMYIIYTNKEKRFQFGKLGKNNSFNEGKPINIYGRSASPITHIESMCILSCNEAILMLNENGIFHVYTHASDDLKIISHVYKKSSKKINDLPERETKYQRVNCSYNEKLIYLQSQRAIDIFDINYEKLKSLEINNFVGWNAFVSGIHDYLVINDDNKTDCYQLIGIENTLDLNFGTTYGQDEESGIRNPILDYLYIAEQKYGSPAEILGCPAGNDLIIESANTANQLLWNYFRLLKFKHIFLKTYIEERSTIIWNKNTFIHLLNSRIPIHIASIQNYTLVPFSDGKYDFEKYVALINQNNRKVSKIELLSESIRFGHYDDLIKKWPGAVHVISIIGKQSSGKSYILNRLFGTRFNVAGTRCTDGIWMSTAFINHEETNMLLIVLDCEGLFSIVRNTSEEMKLCLALASVSDVFIVNQDLSFNRHINSLMMSLTSSIGRLQGKQLFKGCLAFFVRDVSESAFGDAKKEYESNIRTIYSTKDNFISKLFNNQSMNFLFTYFELESFDNRLQIAKNGCFKKFKGSRWLHGEDFIFSLKIVLSQIMIDDDMSLDEHKSKIILESKINYLKDLYFKYNKNEYARSMSLTEDESAEGKKFDHSKIEIERKYFSEDFSQQSPNVFLHKNLDINHIIETYPYKNLADYALKILGPYDKFQHDYWVSEITSTIKEFFKIREKFIIEELNEQFESEESETKQTILRNFYLFFEENKKIAELCDKTCRQCKRKCFNFKLHETDCNCQTDHECDQLCLLTEKCSEMGYICGRDYGHEGEHSCKIEKHKCPEKCKIESCEFFCMLSVNHPETEDHDCKNRHICTHPCQQKNCNKCCNLGVENLHTDHFCGNSRCNYKCKFCSRICSEENHFHEEEIDRKESDFIGLSHHNCGNEHNCPENCDDPGICETGFEGIEKEINNGLSVIKYMYFKPYNNRNNCNKILKPKEQNHVGPCKCKIEIHRCPNKCPECGSFCNLQNGHSGLHMTSTHRNKEFCRFVSSSDKNSVTIGNSTLKKIYKVGDSCEPEICSESCKRKFRSHYHLKECPGNDICPSKTNPKIFHSTEKYHPFPEKSYDKYLCEEYWKSYNWSVPVSEDIAKINKLCSFYCSSCPSTPNQFPTQFCVKQALHCGDHEFECDHKSSNAYQVVFCCDTTGSMGSYLSKSKETVSNIISNFTSISSKATVEFGFVAYRDHPPQDTTYITKHYNFCNKDNIRKFINTLEANGGGDCAEAVLDGINDCVNKLSWKENTNKYLFLISDAPPHGREYCSSGDGFPDGCPCGLKIDRISDAINNKGIKFRLMKIGTLVNKMDEIFGKYIKNYESFPIDSNHQMDLKITTILAEDLKNTELDVIYEL